MAGTSSRTGQAPTAALPPGLPEDAYQRSSVLALDFLEKLGYDTTLLEVSNIESTDIGAGYRYVVLIGNPQEEVLWEVYFDNGAWCLVTIDGRGWLSYNIPNPPK